MLRPVPTLLVSLMLVSLACAAQEAAPAQEANSAPPAARNRALISPQARLLAAKNVYLSNAGGNDIPFNVISGAMEGWGRYILVDAPEKADIVIEVTAPEDEKKSTDEENKTHVSGGSGGRGGPTRPDQSKVPGDPRIKLVVRDAKTKAVLWAQAEAPKDSFRDKKRNDNFVQVAQHLFEQFHNRVEPPPAKE